MPRCRKINFSWNFLSTQSWFIKFARLTESMSSKSAEKLLFGMRFAMDKGKNSKITRIEGWFLLFFAMRYTLRRKIASFVIIFVIFFACQFFLFTENAKNSSQKHKKSFLLIFWCERNWKFIHSSVRALFIPLVFNMAIDCQ